jgi:hypothetical protein
LELRRFLLSLPRRLALSGEEDERDLGLALGSATVRLVWYFSLALARSLLRSVSACSLRDTPGWRTTLPLSRPSMYLRTCTFKRRRYLKY